MKLKYLSIVLSLMLLSFSNLGFSYSHLGASEEESWTTCLYYTINETVLCAEINNSHIIAIKYLNHGINSYVYTVINDSEYRYGGCKKLMEGKKCKELFNNPDNKKQIHD